MKDWLLAGSPAHYLQILALVLYAVLEWVLPRVKVVKANSTLEAIGNALKPLLVKVPIVGKFVALLATPASQSLLQETK